MEIKYTTYIVVMCNYFNLTEFVLYRLNIIGPKSSDNLFDTVYCIW